MAEAVKKSYWGSYPPASVTPSGSPVADVMAWNKDQTALVKTGERNLQDEINAAAKGITPYEVFDRVAKTGDKSLLGEDTGFYGDASGAPETISDAYKMLSNAASQQAALDKAAADKAALDKAAADKAAADKAAADSPAAPAPVIPEVK